MKKSFASNISLRKAAAELQRARNLHEIASLLEKSLQSDFDGFELNLEPQFLLAEGVKDLGQKSLKRGWKNGYVEKTVFTLQLATPQHRLIGQISCYRPVDEGWFADTDLLSGDFRRSLALALEHCIVNAQPQRLQASDNAEQDASYHDLALDHAMRHPAVLEAVSNFTAVSSGGD
jgi:hypothetical protein